MTHVLPNGNLWISVVALGASMYGAYLGGECFLTRGYNKIDDGLGHLVYHHGWGVHRQVS